ncbi:MAG: hypothetical protein ACRCT8_07515 [Lacipirellulaceae bacterium]
MNRTATCFLSACLALCAASSNAALIAYWDENTSDLDPGAGTEFGYFPGAFPKAAAQGAGSLNLANFDATLDTTGADVGTFDFVDNFGGTTLSAQPSILSGGALAPEGGPAVVGGTFANNGMSILISVNTLTYEDIFVSWDQRGTTSGFAGRQFSYSTDGVNFTNVGSDTGTLPTTFATKVYDLSAIAAVDNAPSVTFRILLTGATGATGNNRFDNITVQGTVIPEPGSALIALLGLAGAGAVTMRARLG